MRVCLRCDEGVVAACGAAVVRSSSRRLPAHPAASAFTRAAHLALLRALLQLPRKRDLLQR